MNEPELRAAIETLLSDDDAPGQLRTIVKMPWGGDRNIALRSWLYVHCSTEWDTHAVHRGDGIAVSTTSALAALKAFELFERTYPDRVTSCDQRDDTFYLACVDPRFGLPQANRATRRRAARKRAKR